MKYLITFYAQPTDKNPKAWWDIKETIIDSDVENLKNRIIEYLKNEGVLNKKFKFNPIFSDFGDSISGVTTDIYTEMFDEDKQKWVNVYFTMWIEIKKLCSVEEDIKKAFKIKGE